MDDELMKCATCGTPRASRYAAYCHVCGSPLPELPPAPDDPNATGQGWEGPAAAAGARSANANPAGTPSAGVFPPGAVRQDYSAAQQPGAAPAPTGAPGGQAPQEGGVRVYDRPETPPSVVRRRRLTWILMAVGLLISLILLFTVGPLKTVFGARSEREWTPPETQTPAAGVTENATLPPGVSAAQATARARHSPTPTLDWTATAAAIATSTFAAGGGGGVASTVVLPTLAPAATATPSLAPPTNTTVPPTNTATAAPPTNTPPPPTNTLVPPTLAPAATATSQVGSGGFLPAAISGGKAVAFVSDRSGSPQIWVTDAGGADVVQVTRQGQNTSPSWSLDNRYLYYVSARGGQTGVYRFDITTGAEEQVLQDASIISARPLPTGQLASLRTESGRYALYVGDRRIFQSDRSFQFQFSPDGRRVLIDPNADPRVVSVVDVSSTRAQEVAPAKSWNAGWGPGDGMTYVSDRSGIAAVYVAGPNGAEARSVSPGDKWSQAPASSADGARIAFVAGDGGAWNLYVVRSNGENAHKVGNAANPGKSPIWQPAGTLIAFESNRAGNWDIWVTDPSGREQALTTGPGNDVDPAWTW